MESNRLCVKIQSLRNPKRSVNFDCGREAGPSQSSNVRDSRDSGEECRGPKFEMSEGDKVEKERGEFFELEEDNMEEEEMGEEEMGEEEGKGEEEKMGEEEDMPQGEDMQQEDLDEEEEKFTYDYYDDHDGASSEDHDERLSQRITICL
ncbi:unnamed protein product [Cochlearia groenlandica]